MFLPSQCLWHISVLDWFRLVSTSYAVAYEFTEFIIAVFFSSLIRQLGLKAISVLFLPTCMFKEYSVISNYSYTNGIFPFPH